MPDGTKPLPQTNYDFSLVRFCGNQLRAISQEMLTISVFDEFQNDTFQIVATSPRGKWIDHTQVNTPTP